MMLRSSEVATRGSRARRYRTAVVGLSVAVLGGTMLAQVPAGAAGPAPAAAPCPDPVPVDDVTAGLPVTGLTVSSGTTPDEFSGEVVGRLADGIAPGIDMIIAKLEGSVITDPATGAVDRGIWAGMSGSPVYDADGDLVGAVSYGLSWAPSDYAGITPAEDMYAILNHEAPARRPAVQATIAGRVGKVLAADGKVSDRQIEGGFGQLPMKVAVSAGLSTSKLRAIARQGGLNVKQARQYVAAPGGAGIAAEIPIEAGGNLAGTAAYGDVSLSGVGTATAVCGDAVLGFGHPFLFSGTSDLTMHGADALYIQRDDAGGSFKVADPAAPMGAITQDRWAGILGRTGALPPTAVLTSELSSDTGSRTGVTNISSESEMGYAAALHTYRNLLRVLDADTSGTTALDVTIELEGEDGRPLSYHRSNVVSSRWSAAEEPVYDLWNDIDAIVNNRYEDVTVQSIDVEGDITDTLEQLSIGKVERLAGGSWTKIREGSQVTAKAGSTLKLRVALNPSGRSESDPETVRIDLKIPGKADGRRGAAYLTGGGDQMGEKRGNDLESMLAAMSARPSNAAVNASLRFNRPQTTVLESAPAGAPVSGWFSFRVRGN